MVSVEATDFLLSPAVRRWSDVAVALVSAVIYAGLAYTTWLAALKNFSAGTFVMALEVAVPVWPTYFLPPAGVRAGGGGDVGARAMSLVGGDVRTGGPETAAP